MSERETLLPRRTRDMNHVLAVGRDRRRRSLAACGEPRHFHLAEGRWPLDCALIVPEIFESEEDGCCRNEESGQSERETSYAIAAPPARDLLDALSRRSCGF